MSWWMRDALRWLRRTTRSEDGVHIEVRFASRELEVVPTDKKLDLCMPMVGSSKSIPKCG